MATLNVRELGAYIRDQRHSAQISMRQLAKLAGVSNPYLSQIERGMRRPSAEILQQIAKGLRISAEALYVQAGILDERGSASDLPAVILADPHITERQKQVLVEIYESFRKENAITGAATPADAADPAGASHTADPAAASRTADPAVDTAADPAVDTAADPAAATPEVAAAAEAAAAPPAPRPRRSRSTATTRRPAAERATRTTTPRKRGGTDPRPPATSAGTE